MGFLAGVSRHRHKALWRSIGGVAQEEFRVLIGVIALPNDASVALHEKLEFERVGHFRETTDALEVSRKTSGLGRRN